MKTHMNVHMYVYFTLSFIIAVHAWTKMCTKTVIYINFKNKVKTKSEAIFKQQNGYLHPKRHIVLVLNSITAI